VFKKCDDPSESGKYEECPVDKEQLKMEASETEASTKGEKCSCVRNTTNLLSKLDNIFLIMHLM